MQRSSSSSRGPFPSKSASHTFYCGTHFN
jgi:hypothetical protein